MATGHVSCSHSDDAQVERRKRGTEDKEDADRPAEREHRCQENERGYDSGDARGLIALGVRADTFNFIKNCRRLGGARERRRAALHETREKSSPQLGLDREGATASQTRRRIRRGGPDERGAGEQR